MTSCGSFFFVCRSKRSRLLRAKENDGVWLLCWCVWRVECRLELDNSLHGSVQSAGRCQSAPVESSGDMSADENVEVVMSVSGATELVLFCKLMLLVWNPALSWPKILLPRPVSPLPWPPWLGDLPSAVTDQKSHFSLHLQGAIVHAGSATTKQTVNSLMSEVGTNTVTSPTTVPFCGEDDAFACWEPNSCRLLAITNKLPFNVCTLVTLKSAHVALGRLK